MGREDEKRNEEGQIINLLCKYRQFENLTPSIFILFPLVVVAVIVIVVDFLDRLKMEAPGSLYCIALPFVACPCIYVHCTSSYNTSIYMLRWRLTGGVYANLFGASFFSVFFSNFDVISIVTNGNRNAIVWLFYFFRCSYVAVSWW